MQQSRVDLKANGHDDTENLLAGLTPLSLGQEQQQPYVILDEYDIAENRDKCCNNSLGRAAREWAWHGSMHALKFTVFNRERLCERICWGFVAFAAFFWGLFISVLLILSYFDRPVFVTLDKIGLQNGEIAFPVVRICPGSGWVATGEIEAARKREIETKFPPMFEMWPLWARVFEATFDPDEITNRSLPWRNDTAAVRALMNQVRRSVSRFDWENCSSFSWRKSFFS